MSINQKHIRNMDRGILEPPRKRLPYVVGTDGIPPLPENWREFITESLRHFADNDDASWLSVAHNSDVQRHTTVYALVGFLSTLSGSVLATKDEAVLVTHMHLSGRRLKLSNASLTLVKHHQHTVQVSQLVYSSRCQTGDMSARQYRIGYPF